MRRIFMLGLLVASLLGGGASPDSRGDEALPGLLPCAACHLEDELPETRGGLRMLRPGLPETPLCPVLGPLLEEVACTERAYVRFRWDVRRFGLGGFLPEDAVLRAPDSLAVHMGLPLKEGGDLRLEARGARSSLLRVYDEVLEAREDRRAIWARWVLGGTLAALFLLLLLVIRRGLNGGEGKGLG